MSVNRYNGYARAFNRGAFGAGSGLDSERDVIIDMRKLQDMLTARHAKQQGSAMYEDEVEDFVLVNGVWRAPWDVEIV